MSEIKDFEPLLKEVVQGKRLSASKMQKLTELAMKCTEHDTQMVSTLYRTHKSLENGFKISSLYVFDALARAAKSKAAKQGLSVSATYPTGNPATFLSKLGGVVEGLFRDMVTSDIPESKVKTKKVLDIWVKGGTFPADQLTSLAKIVEGEKESTTLNGTAEAVRPPTPELFVPPAVTSIPPANVATTNPQTPQEVNPQAALLALLAQAANTSSLQSNVNIPAAPFGAMQLAALQQLTANVPAAVPNVPLHTLTSGIGTLAPHLQGNSFTAGLPNISSPIPDDPRRPNRDDSRLREQTQRPISPEAGRATSHEYRSSDPRSHTRDPRPTRDPRSTNNSARGRGDWEGRRKWEDREGLNHRAERDSKDYRGRSSRSRSPPSRFADRRRESMLSPNRSRSPPRRGVSHQSRPAGVLKDEFGRDIRADSPVSTSTPLQTPPITHRTPAVASTLPSVPSTSTTAPIPTHTEEPRNGALGASSSLSTASSTNGMENFDFSTFDLTSAASWEALGKMWEVTYGCPPRGDQLMQFVMSLSLGAMGMAPPLGGNQDPVGQGQGHGQQWGGGAQDSGKQSWGNSGRGNGHGMRGPGGGRGGLHGNGQRTYNTYLSSNHHGTDAIVLGGGDDSMANSQEAMGATPTPTSAGGGGGKMQKVGDKWVFVRNG